MANYLCPDFLVSDDNYLNINAERIVTTETYYLPKKMN